MEEPQSYVYSSEPQSNKGKSQPRYREDEPPPVHLNLMNDPRIVRGNTYSAQVVTQNAQLEAERIRKENTKRQKMEDARRRRDANRKPDTPPPVDGRSHMSLQTETFLEELTDRPVENDAETQTQAFLDRPPSPLFVPTKIGVDVDTQIEEGDLFDFDLEVRPLLEVLVGKTLEISMVELMEEEELAAIRRRQEEFERVRNAELAEVQRVETEAQRRYAEKNRRMKQETDQKEAAEILSRKVAARGFVKEYLGDVREKVFDELQERGHFYDPVRMEVTEVFLPWAMDEIITKTNAKQACQKMVGDLLGGVVGRVRGMQAENQRIYDEEQERIRKEAEEAEAEKIRLEEEAERKRLEEEEGEEEEES